MEYKPTGTIFWAIQKVTGQNDNLERKVNGYLDSLVPQGLNENGDILYKSGYGDQAL